MQTKEEIEKEYENEDPWKYRENIADMRRKKRILSLLVDRYQLFNKALDVGAGEGFLTQDLPAIEIYGYEISDNAAKRFPDNVKRFIPTPDTSHKMRFDLVMATGSLYRHYDAETMINIIAHYSSRIILTSHIDAWEIDELKTPAWIAKKWKAKEIYHETFPYREWNQSLRIFEKLI